ncbi:diguanylate cyclase [Pseudoxanthomonas sp.]|jgi:diguanylate cyclase (GGDEF)-like protein|uniref:GGDEF domain-containing protein n=1 Tax=Pseudoxanthomonas sp. TaxID=1871049 RepID=UPI003F802725
MTTDFYHLLISDCALAAVLLGLFFYVSRVSRGVRGITAWGVAHFVYSLGAALLDGTAQVVSQSGSPELARVIAGLGGVLACAGLIGLAWSVIQFVHQRALLPVERALMPLALALPLGGWVLYGDSDAQGAAMSAVEVFALAVMIWQLRLLRTGPDHVPARLMMIACVALLYLYGRDLAHALTGRYGPNPSWVNADLSIWFMLNFCMLMLASFRAAESLRQSALFDPLTGALNRRGLDSELRSSARFVTLEGGLAVVALDLDHFKAVNDHHGHQTGDRVLQRFSDVVRGCIRSDDLFVRLGGEEFMLVLRETSPEVAHLLAERIRTQVMSLEFASPAFRITVSLGIAHTRHRHTVFNDMMRLADEALYAAKRNGRNCIELRLHPAPAR